MDLINPLSLALRILYCIVFWLTQTLKIVTEIHVVVLWKESRNSLFVDNHHIILVIVGELLFHDAAFFTLCHQIMLKGWGWVVLLDFLAELLEIGWAQVQGYRPYLIRIVSERIQIFLEFVQVLNWGMASRPRWLLILCPPKIEHHNLTLIVDDISLLATLCVDHTFHILEIAIALDFIGKGLFLKVLLTILKLLI